MFDVEVINGAGFFIHRSGQLRFALVKLAEFKVGVRVIGVEGRGGLEVFDGLFVLA